MVAVGVEGLGAWAWGVVWTLLLIFVFIVSSILNTIFLVIFCRRPALRSISNKFIVSLTVCNLVASWVLLPLVVADTYMPHLHSPSLCRTLDALSELVASASVFATLLIAVDRFCAITDPLHYHMLVTRVKGVLMMAGGWVMAAGLAAASALGDLAGRPWNVCSGTRSSESKFGWDYRSSYKVANLLVSFAAPVAVLVWLYAHIYLAAHRNSKRTRRNSLSGSSLDAVTHSRPPSRTPSTRSTSSQIVSSLRYRISNASLFLHKEESRAAKISVVVIVLFLVCWLPYYAASLLHTPLIQVWMPSEVQGVVMLLALSNSAVSPYLYLYRSRRIQREVRRLLGLPLSATKTSGGAAGFRRRPLQRLNLEMIPPSPTDPDANFDGGLGSQFFRRGMGRSPITAIITKLFREKGIAWEPWRHSFTSSFTSSTSSASSSSSTSTGTSSSSTGALCACESVPESESMLPRVVVASAVS